MKLSVVGTGYVGLVTGTCFAENGNEVTCVDVDREKVEQMQAGQIPIYEPGLEHLVQENLDNGRLRFTTELREGVLGAAAIFLALPTPPEANGNGSADLSFVLGVAKNMGGLLTDYTVIVNKSTVPVGTAARVREIVSQDTDVEFDVVSNPEFLREGFAVEDFMKPDRVVIGTSSQRAEDVMRDLYEPFVMQGNPVMVMPETDAELTKYVANSFLAMKISYMNEVAGLCETVGANVDNIRLGIGEDERIGKRFLFPGIGYGGSCFPKDVKALLSTGEEYGSRLSILEAVEEVNRRQRQALPQKIVNYFGEDLEGKTFALWGLAFKPNTDDIRESPALDVLRFLISRGANVRAYDPEAMPNTSRLIPANDQLRYAKDGYSALDGADALVIATIWSSFKRPDFGKIRESLNSPVIFDGRNLWQPDKMQAAGFHYESIGRPLVQQS